MKTVPSLCAFGTGIALGPSGLALIRDSHPHHDQNDDHMLLSSPPLAPLHHASPGYHPPSTPLRSRSRSQSRLAAAGADRLEGKARLGGVGQKRKSPSIRIGSDNIPLSMSNARPLSRQTSSPANTILTVSDSSPLPSSLPPNKLVKRSPSIQSTRSATSTSRLPLPVFRRPATSHERLREGHSRPSTADMRSLDAHSNDARDPTFQSYFTPKVARRRRATTSIPNPIRRVFPDRKYTPVLVSATEPISRAPLETDEASDEEAGSSSGVVASSPIFGTATAFPNTPPPRRSFSIGGLLSNNAMSGSRRLPSQSHGRGVRLPKQRVVSAPHTTMGGSISRESEDSSERPSKRRELTDPQATRPYRESATRSEFASTVGSDSEKSVGDVSTDYQSDTPYDSYPTRTTRGSIGKRGPHIETIFDESPPLQFSSGRSTRLRDLLDDGSYYEPVARYRHSTIEEEGSVLSTPQRSLRDNSVTSTPSARPRGPAAMFSSSPPTMHVMPDPEEIDWDAPAVDFGVNGYAPPHSLPFRLGPGLHPADGTTPQRSNGSERARLFEWSETQPSPSANQTPPRPRTVHGKKDPENRGSRTTSRRTPSAMHARSHSVPVVPDVDSKRSNVVANKFGTWGVGSKAVTEDWNEDFEFDEPTLPALDSSGHDERRVDSGHIMFVPKSIREQQENVVANIGLLREWGLLIEELKELRIRAVALDMLNGPYAKAWQEVDAMIELADQETEEITLEPRRSPPSSPGFDYSAFEEPMSSLNLNHHGASRPHDTSARPSDAASPTGMRVAITSVPTGSTPEQLDPDTRPRKDSEAVARSVIEALQAKRSTSDSTSNLQLPEGEIAASTLATSSSSGRSTPRKVPFDTATLRHIVPYVKGLKRKVKNALRETEALYTSPHRRSNGSPSRSRSSVRWDGSGGDVSTAMDEVESPFQRIFSEPRKANMSTTDALKRRERRLEAATDHVGFEARDNNDEVNVDDDEDWVL